jgi:hypothetical protein
MHALQQQHSSESSSSGSSSSSSNAKAARVGQSQFTQFQLHQAVCRAQNSNRRREEVLRDCHCTFVLQGRQSSIHQRKQAANTNK